MKRLLIVFVTALLVAQDPAPPQPVIKVTSHLVQLSVVVHNKKGEPVTDLKAEDFSIFDKGKEQKIRYFALERSTVEGSAPPPLPAGIYSNKMGGDPQHPVAIPNSLTVILIDGLNTRVTDQLQAKQSVMTFL